VAISVFYNEEFYLRRCITDHASGSQLTTWHYISEDKTLQVHPCENLKSNSVSSHFTKASLNHKSIQTIIYLLFNWTANGFLPGDSGTTIKYNTILKQNTAYKATQTIKDALHTTEYSAKKVKLSLWQAVEVYRDVKCQLSHMTEA
jgi:hypothetical protein